MPKPPAKEDAIFDPEDVTADDDAAPDEAPPAAAPEPDADDAGDGGDPELIGKLVAALAAKNIVVPDHQDKTLREFIEHLLTALATSDAHGANDPAGDPNGTGDNQAGGGSPDMSGNAQPESYGMMSAQIAALERENANERKKSAVYLSRLADVSTERLGQKLKQIIKADLMDESEAKEHRNAIAAKKLSVASGDDMDLVQRIKLIDYLYSRASKKLKTDELLKEHVELSLSANAKEVPSPVNQWAKEITAKQSDEAADELVGKRRTASV